ncbi:MAG: tRNA lysidine(34) synthetase TilS [Muribaculaceae bacterium]|nr:tRNA lysidine(34) synthetase TilS [Muribaculaceae bacterium]
MTTELFEQNITTSLSALGISNDAHIGVAISGGADSVALLTALSRTGYNITALHCDFSLRGEESDNDRHYCETLTDKFGIALHQIKFDTRNSQMQGESIEMTCRRLRYEWFEQQASLLSLHYIALGHHCEDSIETMLLNLTRGSGPKGLSGIAQRRGIYIRPMLQLSRCDIESYLNSLNISWRTDSTNLANDYRRNALRNLLIPQLYEIIPTAQAGMLRTAEAMSHSTRMLSTYLSWAAKKYFVGNKINLDMMRHEDIDLEGTLYLLIPQCFGCEMEMDVVRQILAEPDNRASRLFPTSDGRQLELYAGQLELFTAENHSETIVTLLDDIIHPIEISISETNYECFRKSPKNQNTIWLDGKILDEPHTFKLRHRRNGDRMRPFGAPGQRLISDILSEQKISQSERNRLFILTMDNNPIWIIGVRAADIFRVTEKSERIIKLHFKNTDKS